MTVQRLLEEVELEIDDKYEGCVGLKTAAKLLQIIRVQQACLKEVERSTDNYVGLMASQALKAADEESGR